MTGLCIFMTLINMLANPENVKLYVQIKNYAILIIHLLKENTKMGVFFFYLHARCKNKKILIITILKLQYIWI